MKAYIEVDLPETAAGLEVWLAWAVDQWRDADKGTPGQRMFLALAGEVVSRMTMVNMAALRQAREGEKHEQG